MYNKSQLSRDLKAAKEPRKLTRPKDKMYTPDDDVSRMGYRDDSPFRDREYIDINTPNGTIDMSNTGIDLIANGRFLPKYSGIHYFDTDTVREIPFAEDGGEYMDLDEDEIAAYRAGGYIVDETPYPERHNPANSFAVTDPRSMQYGGPATAADSAQVAANAKRVMDFYKGSGNYTYQKGPFNFNKVIPPMGKDLWNNIQKETNKLNTSKGKKLTTAIKMRPAPVDVPLYKYWSKPGPDKNKVYAREFANAIIDIDAPMSLYDRRLDPQYYVNMAAKKGPLGGDMVALYMYDPLAITPAAKLTDAEITKRYKKFGPSGIPESRLITLGLIKPAKSNPPSKGQKSPQTTAKVKTSNESKQYTELTKPFEDSFANMVKVDYPTDYSKKSQHLDENGNIVTETIYYDKPQVDKLPFRPLPNVTYPDTPDLNLPEYELIKRYNQDQNKWIADEALSNSPEAQQYRAAESWRLQNPQTRNSSHAVTQEEKQAYEDRKNRVMKMIMGLTGGSDRITQNKLNTLDLKGETFAYGGQYNIGDEVDEDTYLYLKSIGYEFE